jgi:TRAP-type C4-dicarboxylate transport system permease small subunit
MLYHIIATVIFAIFILFVIWFLYKYLNQNSNFVDDSIDVEKLSDHEKSKILKLCSQLKSSKGK